MKWLIAFLLLSATLSAQSQPQPVPEPANQSTNYQQIRTNDALETIASQLSAIREQTARVEKERAEREANPFWPPVWSNWILIFFTGGAAIAAIITLGKLERQTKAATVAAQAASDQVVFTRAQKRISDKQLRLLYAPCFELEIHRARCFDLDVDEHPSVVLNVVIRNTGAAPIHFRKIQSTASINNSVDALIEYRSLNTILGVGRPLPLRIESDELSADNKKAYRDGRLFVRVDLLLELFDPTTEQVVLHRRFRRVMCGVSNNEPPDIGSGSIDEVVNKEPDKSESQPSETES